MRKFVSSLFKLIHSWQKCSKYLHFCQSDWPFPFANEENGLTVAAHASLPWLRMYSLSAAQSSSAWVGMGEQPEHTSIPWNHRLDTGNAIPTHQNSKSFPNAWDVPRRRACRAKPSLSLPGRDLWPPSQVTPSWQICHPAKGSGKKQRNLHQNTVHQKTL